MEVKAYTDIEQGRKLAEILPIESADCYWSYDSFQGFHRIEWFEEGYDKQSQLREKDIPSWSLAILLKLLPEVVKKDRVVYSIAFIKECEKWTIFYEEYVHWDELPKYDNLIEQCSENLLDTAYNVILELHNKKLL